MRVRTKSDQCGCLTDSQSAKGRLLIRGLGKTRGDRRVVSSRAGVGASFITKCFSLQRPLALATDHHAGSTYIPSLDALNIDQRFDLANQQTLDVGHQPPGESQPHRQEELSDDEAVFKDTVLILDTPPDLLVFIIGTPPGPNAGAVSLT